MSAADFLAKAKKRAQAASSLAAKGRSTSFLEGRDNHDADDYDRSALQGDPAQ